jgi:hypothetical protein
MLFDDYTKKVKPREGCYIAGGVLLALSLMPSTKVIGNAPTTDTFAIAKTMALSPEVSVPFGTGLGLGLLGGAIHVRQRLMDRRARRQAANTPSA